MSGAKCGGVGEAKQATPEVQEIVSQVRSAVEEKTGQNYDVFEAVQYATQVVAGTNFFVKVHIGDEDHLHLRIFRNLQNELSLHSLQEGKSASDPVTHF